MAMGAGAGAEEASVPLQGRVKKTDAPPRIARPRLPKLEGSAANEQATLELGSFEIKQQPALNVEDWKPFELTGPGSSTTLKKQEPRNAVISVPVVPAAAADARRPGLQAQAEEESLNPFARDLAVISKYNVLLLIDQSGSMATDDCDGKSRWQWCEDEARNFCATTAGALPNGIDLTLFSHHYRDLGAVHAQDLHRVFSNHHPHGGTMLQAPMNHILERIAFCYRNGDPKPAIVAVITDGEPVDMDAVEEMLVATTRRFPQELVKIVFLKVGQGARGDEFIGELDRNLYAHGAAYDIVDYRDFNYLRVHGLLRTLCDAVAK